MVNAPITRPYGTRRIHSTHFPSFEALGYFRSSLWDGNRLNAKAEQRFRQAPGAMTGRASISKPPRLEGVGDLLPLAGQLPINSIQWQKVPDPFALQLANREDFSRGVSRYTASPAATGPMPISGNQGDLDRA
ncbi:hypothetical protein I41_02520 [Lacipirellula limnantheis]|uniref:Uncharacterized protein n=1 Tax=Lacipirellula limnantheis TaxID=2528024 RepID=A0A517TRU1_9BACT|nr:hypothetical protein I41_02520 [Lacipirellula limnantheis]